MWDRWCRPPGRDPVGPRLFPYVVGAVTVVLGLLLVVGLVVGATVGQMLGKMLWYYGGREIDRFGFVARRMDR